MAAQRFVLIDYLHLVYKCIAAAPLSYSVRDEYGNVSVIDTRIINYTSKDIWNFSGHGRHPTAVFFEGGAPIRRAYFEAVAWKRAYDACIAAGESPLPLDAVDVDKGYKSGRTGMNRSQKDGVERTRVLLQESKVSIYAAPGFEADDSLYTMYRQLRTNYPDAFIDIFTGDMDLLPLVDEKTSVFLRGSRTIYDPMCEAGYCGNCRETCQDVEKCKFHREFHLYSQVTPHTWDSIIGYRSAFKGFNIPYNSIYLFKMLRGDTSDVVPMAAKGYGARRWNDIVERMQADGVDFVHTFRYDVPWDVMEPILKRYFPEDVVAAMRLNAEGLRLRSSWKELVEAIPYPDSQIDAAACFNTFMAGQTYQPRTLGEAKKAQLLFDCFRSGINPVQPVAFIEPSTPDLGLFGALAQKRYGINLSKTLRDF